MSKTETIYQHALLADAAYLDLSLGPIDPSIGDLINDRLFTPVQADLFAAKYRGINGVRVD